MGNLSGGVRATFPLIAWNQYVTMSDVAREGRGRRPIRWSIAPAASRGR